MNCNYEGSLKEASAFYNLSSIRNLLKMSEIKVPISHHEESPKQNSLIGVRHFQALLHFITLLIFFIIRTSLSVSIISMTKESAHDSTIPTYPDWGNTDIILSSFFWGYVLPQPVAGQLSEYFGPKWFLFTTMVIGSVFHITVPVMAEYMGSSGVMICRIVQGLTQGFLYPSIQYLISRWTSFFERSLIANFIYGGSPLGIAIAMPLTGLVCSSTMGWPLSFYLFGGLGICWAVIFAIFCEDSPEAHQGISEEERRYIETTNGVTEITKIPTPWKSILTSTPVWAVLVAGCAQCFSGFTLLTEIPSYMSGVMGFDISDNSMLSGLPYVAVFLVGITGAPFIDKIVSKNIVSITTIRKISNSLASFIPAAALVYLSYIDKSQKELATTLLVIGVGATAFTQSGYLLNLIDVAPNHAGTLLGVVNGVNNIFSILGPLTVGLLGSDKTDPILWRKVFLITAGILTGSGLFYVFFTSAEVQPWNDIKQQFNTNSGNEKDKNTKVSNKYKI